MVSSLPQLEINLDTDAEFVGRHIGVTPADLPEMLSLLGYRSLEELINAVIPPGIRLQRPLALGEGLSETAALQKLRTLAQQNQVWRSYIGMGYYNCITPAVIQRNILENPGWYTAYTPYQAEIAQGRLEALLNFQTLVSDLTAFPIANASLLDEATAAAEAMTLSLNACRQKGAKRFLVAQDCHPQTLAVLRTRALPLGIEIVPIDPIASELPWENAFGLLLQYPATDGAVRSPQALIAAAHERGLLVTVATDLLALTC